ncbi:MAG: ATP-dependent DNA helicase RecG [Planctomycetaceae bacterium]
MDESPLDRNIQYIKGVGPQRAALLGRLGLNTVSDLLFNLPRDLLDLTRVTPMTSIVEGESCQVRGRVVDLDARPTRQGGTITGVAIEDQGQYVRGIWFNQPWMLSKFKFNDCVLFSGKPKRRAGRWEFGSPHVQWLDPDDGGAHGGVLTRYHLTEGLKMHELRRIIRGAVEEHAHLVPDPLPPSFRDPLGLPSLAEAVRLVHLPNTVEQFQKGLNRIVHEDLLEFQVGLSLRRRAWQRTASAPVISLTAKVDARIRRLFPFRFTAGQDRAIAEICHDLAAGRAMHRLLQADVGAGKTVVAIYALLLAVAAGHQGVLMAPTEVLARQHWQTFEQCLQHSRVERVLLTGTLSSAERRAAHEKIRSGQAQLIVGTQALIQKDVSFSRLGLVVIDEQHRFGVRQRSHFVNDTSSTPHTLVMTATPIPRSLALTQFGDLEISLVRELPPGRQPVSTHIVAAGPQRAKAWEFVLRKLASGRQAYIVCPRIDAREGDPPPRSDVAVEEPGTTPVGPVDGSSAEQVFHELRQGILKNHRVGLLHGQLGGEHKQEIMRMFRQGELQALVSTTVIEVGVDVPNASLLVVFDAERFGLAQLHQLRGRVGRGAHQGYCFLFPSADTPEARTRLGVLVRYTDGFEVAEADFRLRGPGDVLGTRQHGDLPLQSADLLRDAALLETTREQAQELVRSGQLDTPDYAPLKQRVLARFGELMEISGGG